MRHRMLLPLIALCGCASAGGAPDQTARQAPIFTSAETGTIIGEAPRAARAEIAAPVASVWLAAKAVYTDLGIPVTVESPPIHQIGNTNFYRTRNFAGKGMTSFVDCGSGMDGPKAASYRIYMSLLSTVEADGKGGTTLQTTFVPAGQDLSGNSSDRIPCGTTGRLEALFNDRVKAVLGK